MEAEDEARIAIENIVIPRKQPIELRPQAPDVLELQVRGLIPSQTRGGGRGGTWQPVQDATWGNLSKAMLSPAAAATAQVAVVLEYGLKCEKAGTGADARLRILPLLLAAT